MFLFSLWYYSKIIKKACFQYSIFWFINKLKTIKLIYKFMRNTTHKESIHLVYPSLTKKGAIYIGNLNAAKNFEILKEHNLGAVVTASQGTFLDHSKDILPNYLYIPAHDHQQFDISEYFDKTFEFIDKALNKTNVLVHCRAGISRSATIVIAYIMRKQKKNWIEAYKQIKQYRPIIQPNDGFLRQLKNYSDTVLKPSNKIENQQQKKQIRQRGLSCVQIENTDSKQNSKSKRNNNICHEKSQNCQITKVSKSLSKLRHRYKLSQVTAKRQSIPWAIHY